MSRVWGRQNQRYPTLADRPGHSDDASSPPPLDGGVTELLLRWTDGESDALELLMPAVYAELKKTASALMGRERAGHTLQPTALVHGAWLRLVRQDRVTFEHRKLFFGLAAQLMRRILVDHVRAAKAGQRGGGIAPASIARSPSPVKTRRSRCSPSTRSPNLAGSTRARRK